MLAFLPYPPRLYKTQMPPRLCFLVMDHQNRYLKVTLQGFSYCGFGASLVAQMAKKLSAMWETWVRSLGREDPLKKGMATHSSIFA